MTLDEVLASRETAQFSGFNKETLVNLFRWQPGTNEVSGDVFEMGTFGKVFTLRHAVGELNSGSGVSMTWETFPEKNTIITAKVMIPWTRYVDLLVSGALQWEYQHKDGNRKYKVNPPALVLVDAEAVVDLTASYLLDPYAVVPKWSDPVPCGNVFVKPSVWPVEAMKSVVTSDGREMNVYEQIFWTHTGRRIPTTSEPEKLLPPNISLWGGMDTSGEIDELGTKEKFIKGSGSDVDPKTALMYNTLYGSDPASGDFRITIPYVTYDDTYGEPRINHQKADEFAWDLFEHGNPNNFYHSPDPKQLTGTVTDGEGTNYKITLVKL